MPGLMLARFTAFFNEFACLQAACAISRDLGFDEMANKASLFHEQFSGKIAWLAESLAYAQMEKSARFYRDFAELHADLQKSGSNFNIWDVMGLKRREVINTRIFAWFLKSHAAHGQGALFLEAFLDLIPDTYWSGGARPIIASRYQVREEANYQADGSRLDVEIDSNDFFLIIEAKIDTCEHDEQLARYAEIAKRVAPNKPWAIAHLAPFIAFGPSYANTCSILWRDVARAFDAAMRKATAGSVAESPAQILCSHFCEHIRNL